MRVGRWLGTFDPDGVLMNGNGCCLEAVPGRRLFIDFAAQRAGAPSQLWHYRSALCSSGTRSGRTKGTGLTGSGRAG